MTNADAAGAAFNASVKTVTNKDRVEAVIETCLNHMDLDNDGGLVNTGKLVIYPTDLLKLMGLDCGSGSQLAERYISYREEEGKY